MASVPPGLEPQILSPMRAFHIPSLRGVSAVRKFPPLALLGAVAEWQC